MPVSGLSVRPPDFRDRPDQVARYLKSGCDVYVPSFSKVWSWKTGVLVKASYINSQADFSPYSKSTKIGCFQALLLFQDHFPICIVPHYTQDARIHKNTQIASRKLHHFPVVSKLDLSLTIPPVTPQVSLSLLPYLTILVFFLHFNSVPKLRGPNCPVNSVGWTGRREVCANARVSVLSPSLFIFLSKWCCQEPNKISLSALAQQGVNTPSRKWNIRGGGRQR